MSISSDVSISRKKALEKVYRKLMAQHEDLVIRALNAMSNDDLAGELHCDMYFYHVDGKAKLLKRWEDGYEGLFKKNRE